MEIRPVFALGLFLIIMAMEVNGMVEPIPMPEILAECYKFRTRHFNISKTPTQEINSFCITKYLYETAHLRYQRPIANETILYAQELFRKLVGDAIQFRKKRQAPMLRREIRTLSRDEWMTFTDRINRLKREMVSPTLSRYDSLADIHRLVIFSAHNGPAFLGWHRVYLLVFQQAVGVPVPYWDSRLDYYMENPTDSVIWTPEFFGNGFGNVDEGPFANWQTPEGVRLIRNIGNDGTLISDPAIAAVLSRNSHAEIVEPNPVAENSLEGHHNGPHVWIDGQISAPATAAQDPVFFMHHSFIDFVWQQFRDRLRGLGIDPSTDYPPTNVRGHGRFDRLIPWNLRNIHGYHNYFERFSTYAPSPTCPACADSRYLECRNGRCVSAVGIVPAAPAAAAFAAARAGFAGAPAGAPPSAGGAQRVMMAAAQAGPLPIGPRFRSAFVDPRTRGDTLANAPARMRRSLTGENYTNSIQDSIKVSSDTQINKPYQNTFVINGVSDIKLWAFVPVRIIYERPDDMVFDSHPISNGTIDATEDLYKSNYKNKDLMSEVPRQGRYSRCHVSGSGASKVVVQSDGIDYSGRYKDYAIMDERQPISSAMTYVGVRNPVNGSSRSYITAYDSCGRVCRVRCLVGGSYRPCSGAFLINSEMPLMYGETYEDAVQGVWVVDGKLMSQTSTQAVPIVFLCDFNGEWPWTYT